MTSTIVYAIMDMDSGLFVTKGLLRGLDDLGIDTKFFNYQTEAMRVVEDPINEEFKDFKKYTKLQNDLAWWLLEKVYEKDRWNINCGMKELCDAANQFKNLKVVPVRLECKIDLDTLFNLRRI